MKRLVKRLGKVRVALIAVLGVVFLVSIGGVISRAIDYQRGGEDYDAAMGLVNLPDFDALPTPGPLPSAQPAASAAVDPDPAESGEDPQPTAAPPPYVDPYADALRAMDFTALREVNSQVLGWIVIPGTRLSYPLLQGTDNQYYLNHTWRGSRNSVGGIFLECQSSGTLEDFHTIIYGHNVRNGTMFGSLQSYRNWQYWSAHPAVYVTVDGGSYRYEIFAAYEAAVDSSTYQIGFSGDESRQAFLDDCMARSVIDTGLTPTIYDRILTLSTCTNAGGSATRWVVQALLRGEPPADPEPVESDPLPEDPDPAESAEPVESMPPEGGDPEESPEPVESTEPLPEDSQPPETEAVPEEPEDEETT